AHWSHMMGVVPECRTSGLGLRLKVAQRERALAMGLDLIEWTFDPLQAVNAHLNFAKLGAIATTYAVNIYGDSSSALHRGTPTDRLIAEWWLQRPHVERRVVQATSSQARTSRLLTPARDRSVTEAPVLNEIVSRGDWDLPPDTTRAAEGKRALIRV